MLVLGDMRYELRFLLRFGCMEVIVDSDKCSFYYTVEENLIGVGSREKGESVKIKYRQFFWKCFDQDEEVQREEAETLP